MLRSARLPGVLLLLPLVLAACADRAPLDPGADPDAPTAPPPSGALVDGSTGGSDDFFFLPPLGETSNPAGTFNPDLLPAVRVCELDAGLSCLGDVAYFPPGSAAVGNGQYQLGWDTDGSETAPMDPALFYRLQVEVGGEVLGSIDLDPQDPDGPGQATSGFYAFRLGETIPVKFWLSTETLCTGDGYVIECITGAVLDENGGSVSLDQQGERLAVFLPPDGLPGADHPPVTVILERLDPDLFLASEGVECLPLFDAPQYGPCFRITTLPELTDPLQFPALISICLDPTTVAGIKVPLEQEDQLQIVRFATDGSGVTQGLENVPGDCPTSTAGLLTVPEEGLARYAALGVNALARLVGPEPLAAHGDISLGGLTSSFSRFRFALPGQMVATGGDGTVLQPGDDPSVTATVQVSDHEGIAVENARLRFGTTDGTLSQDIAYTDVNGEASLTWTVDASAPGDKLLTVRALGLLSGPVPNHNTPGGIDFAPESITLTVTVVGPPAAVSQSPTGTVSGTAGEEVSQPLVITVTDENGNLVSGAGVTWTASGDGSVSGDASTGADGTASGSWTLSTAAGTNTASATVGGQTATFTAEGAAGPAVTPSLQGDGQTGVAGEALAAPLVVTVTDQYGNPREGDAVTWSVLSGGGSLSATSTATGPDGASQVSWTLGTTAGANQASATVAGFTLGFSATGEAGPAVQPVGDGDGQTGVVGTTLASPLVVTVTDANGNPREGDAVSWSTDGGSLSASSTTTDAAGATQVSWTLGTGAGTRTATATVGSFTVTFSAEALPGDPANLAVSGDGQSGLVGATLAPLSVVVTDGFGNATPGQPVSWSTTDGSLAADATTAADGSASASWTLGPLPGTRSATVSVGGLSHVFTATAACFDGYGIAAVDGTFGAAEWACARSVSFEANLSGGSTPASVHWMNDGTNLYLAVRVRQSALDRRNSLRFDFDNDGDGLHEENDDAIGYDADGGVFIDEFLTRKCANNGQSGCGEADASTDGAGVAANDGVWTTYELSHPLSSGDPRDFSAAKDDVLGFFLTLQVGNGAQGNTQFPGFRVFQELRVVGF